MSISVLLPVYNSEKTLEQSLDSILKQTYPHFEVIAIDDASSDRSLEMLKAAQSKDSRIKIYQNEKNLGISLTLNKAADLAQYEYLARMDQDDESVLNRFQIQKQFLDEHPSVALVGGPYLFMGKSRKKDMYIPLPTQPDKIRDVIQVENPICHPTVMFRKSVFLNLGGYRHEFKNAEDYDLWLRMSRDHDLANVLDPILRYRLSPGGVTLTRRWEMYIYHHLAIESYKRPHEDLDKLKAEVTARLENENKPAFLRMIYRDLASKQWNLGYRKHALAILGKGMREIGVLRFIL